MLNSGMHLCPPPCSGAEPRVDASLALLDVGRILSPIPVLPEGMDDVLQNVPSCTFPGTWEDQTTDINNNVVVT